MSHEHPVIDTDTHFLIDEKTRMVNSTNAAIPKIMQFDCDSERLSFRLPKTIDGHDMTLCNRVCVEYINTDGRNTKTGRYIVNDVSVASDDEEEIVFSWLVSDNATQLNGNLNFVVVFLCVDGGGKITYRWATEIYKGLSVGEGMKNDDAIASEYADALEKWYADVIAAITEGGASIGNSIRIANVVLDANKWNGSGNLYSQIVDIEGVTGTSQVDLTPSVEQLVVFYEKDLTLVTENENGVVVVYAIGQKPVNDYVIQATITEVNIDE